jgi:hypothetical protein
VVQKEEEGIKRSDLILPPSATPGLNHVVCDLVPQPHELVKVEVGEEHCCLVCLYHTGLLEVGQDVALFLLLLLF